MIASFCFALLLLVGCSSKDDFKAVFKEETENWEAKVVCLKESNFEDMTQYYFTLRYKNDFDDFAHLNNINVGYLWLNKDAQFISNQSLSGILNSSYDDVTDSVVYVGNGEKPKRLFELFKSEVPVWEDPRDNKEFSVAFIMPNEVFDKMSPEIEFLVAWGNNEESFRLLKVE